MAHGQNAAWVIPGPRAQKCFTPSLIAVAVAPRYPPPPPHWQQGWLTQLMPHQQYSRREEMRGWHKAQSEPHISKDPLQSHKGSNALPGWAWSSTSSCILLVLPVLGLFPHFFFAHLCLCSHVDGLHNRCSIQGLHKQLLTIYICHRAGFCVFIPLLESFKTNCIEVLNFALQTCQN